MELFVNSIGVLTTIVGFIGLGLVAAVWNQDKSDLLFGLALLLGVTAMFGLMNALNIDADYLLYPIRLGIMGWICYIIVKYE